MEIKQELKLPPRSGEIVEQYLKVLQRDTKYDAFTVSNEFEVIECKGIIRNNGKYNSRGWDNISEDEMYLYTEYHTLNKWFTLNKEEAIKVQQENILAWKSKLEAELNRIANL